MSVRGRARQASATPALRSIRSKGHGFCFEPALVEGRSVAAAMNCETVFLFSLSTSFSAASVSINWPSSEASCDWDFSSSSLAS